jgi:hypothetical protein
MDALACISTVAFVLRKIDDIAFEERPIPKKEDLKLDECVSALLTSYYMSILFLTL